MKPIHELLKDKNLKATPQRIAIIKEIIKHGHITIDEIYSIIKKDFSSISLATVYKNIHSLKDSNILYEIHTQNSKSMYEIKKKTHAHFICQICSEIKDSPINKNDFKNYGNFNQLDLYIYGVCEKCTNSKY